MPLKEAASIRDTALRAMDGTGEGSPKGTPNGKALWMRAKSIAVNGPEQDAAPASRSRSMNPGLVSTRWEPWTPFFCQSVDLTGSLLLHAQECQMKQRRLQV